jgi:hypothetical protein
MMTDSQEEVAVILKLEEISVSLLLTAYTSSAFCLVLFHAFILCII